MAASAWEIHDAAKEMIGNGLIDLDGAGSTFIVILGQDSSNMNTVTTDGYGDVTLEVAENYGYLQGTKTMTTPAWTATGSTAKWDESSTDPVWTASGGDITARYAAIYDDTPTTPTADPIICSCELNGTAVTATDGNTLTITMNAAGIFTLT